jgi:ribose transport system substrate-binding protein
VTFLATNNQAGGQKAADELAACVKARTGKAEGNVAYLTALAGAQSLNDRDTGFAMAGLLDPKKYQMTPFLGN